MAALLGAILDGDAATAMAAVDSAHAAGVDSQALIGGLLDMVHGITRARLSGNVDPALPDADRAAIAGWIADLSFPALHRLWQLLLKGHAEVGQAPIPSQAAEMAILRCVHAAGLPDPEKLAKLLADGAASPAPAAQTPAAPAPAPALAQARRQDEGQARGPATVGLPTDGLPTDGLPTDGASLVALFEAQLEALLAKQLHDDVVILSVTPGLLVLGQLGAVPAGFAAELRKCLGGWTGLGWDVRIEAAPEGAQSLRQLADAARAAAHDAALEDPMVKALLTEFPGAEVVSPAPPRTPAAPPLRSATA
jgi:DNA polymerase-3 subunit gamma/tau